MRGRGSSACLERSSAIVLGRLGGRLLGACEEAAAGRREGVYGVAHQVRQGQHTGQDHQEGDEWPVPT